KRLITADRRRALDDRGKKLAAAHAQGLEQARTQATYAWDASPISTARMAAEIWDVMKGKDWALVSGGGSRLWNVDTHYRLLASGGAAGEGYGAPASGGGGPG